MVWKENAFGDVMIGGPTIRATAKTPDGAELSSQEKEVLKCARFARTLGPVRGLSHVMFRGLCRCFYT